MITIESDSLIAIRKLNRIRKIKSVVKLVSILIESDANIYTNSQAWSNSAMYLVKYMLPLVKDTFGDLFFPENYW